MKQTDKEQPAAWQLAGTWTKLWALELGIVRFWIVEIA